MASERVLITGGAGFIGSALAQRLSGEGFAVRMLDTLSPQVHGSDPATTSATLRIAEAAGEVMVGSVTSREDIERALEDVQVVVHLAAETGTGQSMYEIARYTDVNVGGTSLLLDVLAHREHSLRRIVVASSRAVYGEGKYRAADGTELNPGQRSESDLRAGRFDPLDPRDGSTLVSVPTDEASRLSPLSVYGVTKLSQEQLVLASAPALGVEGVALRYQNVYGPGQALRNPYTGILSIFSTIVRDGGEINVFEDGLESRDFVFIDDVVEATLAAITSEAAAGLAINVGSGVATSVLEVVAALQSSYGATVRSRVTGDYRLGDIRHNTADLALARRALGFEPRVGFGDGIRRFADWVKAEPTIFGDYERSLRELRERKLLK